MPSALKAPVLHPFRLSISSSTLQTEMAEQIEIVRTLLARQWHRRAPSPQQTPELPSLTV